ncbi:hypothetical protein PENFLA_c005G00690 [Penicillium flavigenum]|uniref:Aminoglycoside phosphotransferase domain-containing protein n=1 Tax=Penicillium flavigenum TaxID=254877 RepID=A0A1V6TPM8_9EURO|nr:hypothetical protein PENFLA_c005G00690 [Penicillium flavigenum]
MEDDFMAIVKIPYWISVPKTYATASEVATLTLLRSKGFPVPKVYGWSSTTENPVGVEYRGTPDEDRDSETYCIGPIADYMFWYGERTKLDLDRGPWSDPRQYLLAIANKEIEWTEKFGKLLECDFPYNTVFSGVNSHRNYLELLKKYLAIAPYLLPKNPGDILNRPTLRHPDLTPSNVFVCPKSFDVTCIIDWQHTVITPLLLAAGYPRLFENPSPEPPTGLDPPKYPDDYDTMSPKDKAQVDELIRRQSLFYLYRVFNGGLNKVHLKALQDPLVPACQHLVDCAGRQWSGNLMTLRGALMRIRAIWSHLPWKDENPECPIEFSEQEIGDQIENEPMWDNLNTLVDHWRDELGGLSEEGWIRTEQYDYATKRNQSLKAEFSEGGSADELEKIKRSWPFQDHGSSFSGCAS